MSYSGLAPIVYFPGIMDDLLNDLANKYSTNTGKILQQWLLLNNIGVVTTTSKPSRMEEFFKFPDTPLSEDDARKISQVGLKHYKRKYWADVWDK